MSEIIANVNKGLEDIISVSLPLHITSEMIGGASSPVRRSTPS